MHLAFRKSVNTAVQKGFSGSTILKVFYEFPDMQSSSDAVLTDTESSFKEICPKAKLYWYCVSVLTNNRAAAVNAGTAEFEKLTSREIMFLMLF